MQHSFNSRLLALLPLSVAGALCNVGLAHASEDEISMLGEVVVTANRRSETVLEVPFNIQAISAETLEQINARDVRDFIRMVPGLSFEEGGPRDGTNVIVLRGLTGDYGSNSTTSLYVDDTEVPTLDFKLLDIDRIEVLRGPQGTLYGGGAIGGVIRYISTRPSLGTSEQKVTAGLSSTAHGGVNYEASGTINLPLVEDKLALRASSGHYYNDGYIDNVRLGLDNQNFDRTTASRIALLYAPTESLEATLTYHRQDVRYGTSSTIPTALGEYNFDDHYREHSRGFQNLVNLSVSYELDTAVLTSSTSYTNRDRADLNDDTFYVRSSHGLPDLTAFTNVQTDNDGWTEELRLVSKPGDHWDWIAGAYWTRTTKHMWLQERVPLPYDGQADIEDMIGAPITDDREVLLDNWSSAKQLAAFGELTRHLTESWDVTLGGRYYDYELQGRSWYIDQYYGVDARDANGRARTQPLPDEFDYGVAKTDGSVWKFNTSYELSSGSLLYFTVAEGFRPGGFNVDPNATGSKRQYDPDDIVSYEVGSKLSFADGRAYLSGALYYIDWSDMQTVKYDETEDGEFFYYYMNAGKARSQGVELEFSTRDLLIDGLSLLATYTFTDMQLEEDIDELGLKGDRAPLVPKNSGSVMLDYAFSLASGRTLSFNVHSSYTGTSFNYFGRRYPSGGEIYESDNPMKRSYWLTGLSTSLQSQRWTAQLFVDNLLDKDADISVGSGTSGEGFGDESPSRAITRPRTIGATFTFLF